MQSAHGPTSPDRRHSARATVLHPQRGQVLRSSRGRACPKGMELVRVGVVPRPIRCCSTRSRQRVREAKPEPEEEVIFTAHSLPVRVICRGRPVRERGCRDGPGGRGAGGIVRYHRAFQSAGRTPEPWIGLDLGELLRHRVSRGVRRFLIVPIGFVCDHTEILFDIDVQASRVAAGARGEPASDRVAERLTRVHQRCSNRWFATGYDRAVSDTPQVLVLGGGMAGLAAAYRTAPAEDLRSPFSKPAPGSAASSLSEEVDGFNIDGGPDALLIQKPDGIKLCQELGLGPRLVVDQAAPPCLHSAWRTSSCPASRVGDGDPHRVGPVHQDGSLLVARQDPHGRRSCSCRGAPMPATNRSAPSCGAASATRPSTYLAEPLLAGIHAGDVDRLSIRALFPRFPETEQRFGSLLRAFRSQPRHAPSKDGAFKSLPGGLSELVNALGGCRFRRSRSASARP